MAEKKYLNDVGLADVANHVNTRLKTVTTIPISADNGAVRLYIGATDSTYTKGHTYQYNSSTSTWVDITPIGDVWTTAQTLQTVDTTIGFTGLDSSYAYDVYFDCANGVAPPTLTSLVFTSSSTATATFSAVTSAQTGTGSQCKIRLKKSYIS